MFKLGFLGLFRRLWMFLWV